MSRRPGFPLSQFDYTVKIILLGDHAVGKTSFLTELASDPEERDDVECLEFRNNCHVELEVRRLSKRILVIIADTGGQERYRSITASYYRGAQGCLIMFDAERPDTFSHVYDWNNDLEGYTNRQFLSKFLVGINLNSSRKQVTSDQASRLASQLEMQFHELDPKNRKSAVGLVQRLLDPVMVWAVRMPRVSFNDIRPSLAQEQLTNLNRRASRAENSRRVSLAVSGETSMSFTLSSEDEPPPSKFRCSC